MKNIIISLLLLAFVSILTGCNSSKDETTPIPTPSSTPLASENKKIPTCYIKEGTPKTDSSIVIHAKCKNGNIPIDEATVTLDHHVKPVKYKGTSFSDYIGFRNLQHSTTYKAVLEVVVGGKTIKGSVNIKTREEKVEVTPTPTPTPVVDTPPSNNPPKWTKSIYETRILITEDEKNNFIMNLKSEVLIEPMQELHFSIKKIQIEGYEDNPNVTYDGLVKIENGILKFTGYNMGTGVSDTVIITISAISNKQSSDAKVKFDFLLPTL